MVPQTFHMIFHNPARANKAQTARNNSDHVCTSSRSPFRTRATALQLCPCSRPSRVARETRNVLGPAGEPAVLLGPRAMSCAHAGRCCTHLACLLSAASSAVQQPCPLQLMRPAFCPLELRAGPHGITGAHPRTAISRARNLPGTRDASVMCVKALIPLYSPPL